MTAKDWAVRSPRTALATLIVGLGLSSSALGATAVPVQCERNPSFFDKTMDDGELTVSTVDLSQSETQADFNRVADERRGEEADAKLAPLLYLAPRVESILEDVFTEPEPAEESESEAKDAIAPVAESSPAQEDLKSEGQAPLDVEPALLRIQREMYRTDI